MNQLWKHYGNISRCVDEDWNLLVTKKIQRKHFFIFLIFTDISVWIMNKRLHVIHHQNIMSLKILRQMFQTLRNHISQSWMTNEFSKQQMILQA